MKLNKLLVSLLLATFPTVFFTTIVKSEEIKTDVQNNTRTVGTDATFQQPLSLLSSAQPFAPTKVIPRLSEVERPIMNAQMLVQSPTPQAVPTLEVVQVTGVKANPTNKGLDLVLQTSKGQVLQPINRSALNSFIADIPNAQLRLPSGDAFTFRSDKPIAGVTEITVTNFDAKTIRVTVTGEAKLPTVELFDSPNEGLIFSVASTAPRAQQQQPQTQQPQTQQRESQTQPSKPSAQGEEPIELVVTGEQDGYRVPDASTATRTDTPQRDIPQSIQVVTQQVLQDQNVTRLEDALRNVPGVTTLTGGQYTLGSNSFTIRGFAATDQAGNYLRNGLRDALGSYSLGFANIERIEVLKGPASVLFGQAAPGGTINLVTKQPLRDPFYAIDASVGSYDFYRGAVDLSGPLNTSKTILYRLNTSYQDAGSFVDFVNNKFFSIAPVVSFAIGERTKLALEAEYSHQDTGYAFGLPAVGTVLPNPNGEIPRNRNIGEPNGNVVSDVSRVGYTLKHQFSDNWSLRNAFRVTLYDSQSNNIVTAASLAPNNRTLNRTYQDAQYVTNSYSFTSDVVGKFLTGSIEHQLLLGVDLNRYDFVKFQGIQGRAAPINLFNPVYGQPFGPITLNVNVPSLTDSLGLYIQDQVKLAENLKLLLGVRFDTFVQTATSFTNVELHQSGDAFSPRVGIVYQPIPAISLYASYAKSFDPVSGTAIASNGSSFQPERATQYEIGVKADLNNRLSATLALYDLTRSNVIVADPSNPSLFSLQTGEQGSRGIELSLAGEILPGWKIIAGYAYTDAKITKDTTFAVGNELNNVPKNSFNLWTTYEIQRGSLQGLGFGLGFFFVGDREGDLANTFELPSYFRTDASIFYKRGKFRAALNVRNLFDVDYFDSAQTRLRVFAGEPLTVIGSVSWQF